MHFPVRKGMLSRTVGHVKAVDGVDLTIRAGQTVGLVGESGCGKSTLGRCILRANTPTGGEINYRTADGRLVDLATLKERALKPYRREIRMVFQDPFSSLNPRFTLNQIVGEALRVNHVLPPSEIDDRVATLLRRVGLRAEYRHRYPNAFSGGERQRVGIARALALDPRLVVADEAVSALDVSVRAQILNLLRDLQDDSNLTYLFISHDLGTVEYMADEVVVMYVGKVVEIRADPGVVRQPAASVHRGACCRRCRIRTRTPPNDPNGSCCVVRSPTRRRCRPAARSTRAASTPKIVAAPRCRPCARSAPAGAPPATSPRNSNSAASKADPMVLDEVEVWGSVP